MVSLLLTAPVAAQGTGSFDLLQLLLGASGVVRGVLFLLVCLSIIGWYVIGYKALYLNRAQGESMRFLEAFWQAKRLDAVYQEAEHKRRSPIAHMFKAGYVELSKLQNAPVGNKVVLRGMLVPESRNFMLSAVQILAPTATMPD